VIRGTIASASTRGVRELGAQLLKPQTSLGQRPSLQDSALSALNFSMDQRRAVGRGEAIYKEICAACHAPDGTGAPMAAAPEGTKLAPPLGGSARVTGHRDYMIKVLLHGLTGPMAGTEYPGGVMVPMGTNTDQWIADIANYVRNSFGNSGMFVTTDQVALVRKSTAARKGMWTLPELEASLPRQLTNQAEWKVAASHNPEAAANALAGTFSTRWDTGGAAQQPGMWFQIELPQPASITELHIETTVPFTFGGRGTGGRGAGGRTGAPPAGRGTAAAPQRGGGGGRGGRGGGRGGPPVAGPVAYSVTTSADGQSWSSPVARGAGSTPTTVIAFLPVQARFIRVTQTGTASGTEQWAIAQIRVFEQGK
jgi:mono/diheme cytochrome c family protein